VRRGEAVSYRPPRWVEHGRDGSIDVPAGCLLVIIEGDGAGRREVAHLIDVLIWVQSDEREAERRVLTRIGKPNEAPTVLSTASGWPRKFPSTSPSGHGNEPTSSCAAHPKSPAIRSPRSSSRRRLAMISSGRPDRLADLFTHAIFCPIQAVSLARSGASARRDGIM
jgi:hypothetical protein